MFKADGHLKRIYTNYNQKWFDHRLPSDVRVGWDDALTAICSDGLTIGLEDADNSAHLFFVISIDPELKERTRQTRFTLLHEMAHISVYPYIKHGRVFNEEMLRLAIRGAFVGLW